MSKRGGRLHRLMLKELREILRDRRTIFTLILMPLLVYPMLNLVFQRYLFSSISLEAPASTVMRLGFRSAAEARHVLPMIRFGWEQEQRRTTSQPRSPSPAPGDSTSPQIQSEQERATRYPNIESKLFVDLGAAVKDGGVALGIQVPDLLNDPFRIELLRTKNSIDGEAAFQLVRSALDARNNAEHEAVVKFLRLQGLPSRGFVRMAEVELKADAGPNMLSTLVPLILIMMTVTGAVYPAIDLTAGERERSTLETLFAAPVSRLGLLLAKYSAVVTVAMMTALVNLTAMTATIYSGGLGPMVFGEEGLTVGSIAAVLVLLVLFAAFFSAVLLMITSSARSFKEAQAYLIPLMLVSLGPGLISLLPGVELTMWLAATPLINVVLLARDIFVGQPLGASAIVAVLATATYTFLAIALAARVFGRDAVNQAQSTTPRRVAGVWTAPSPGFSVVCLFVLLPSYLFLGGWLARIQQIDLPSKLILAAGVTGLIFGVIPTIACLWERVPIRKGMRLRRPTMLALIAAGLLGLAAWPFAHELVLWGKRAGIYTLSEGQMERVRQMLTEWRATLSPPLLLLCLAAAPAFFEEWFFRGYLFRAWEERLGAVRTILMTAIVFGAFHVVSGHQITPERFLPSTFLGLLLGTVAYRAGSVWPGILLHFFNNGLLLVMAYYKDDLLAAGIGIDEAESLPGWWLAVALVVCIAGLALLWLTTPRPNAEEIATAVATKKSTQAISMADVVQEK